MRYRHRFDHRFVIGEPSACSGPIWYRRGHHVILGTIVLGIIEPSSLAGIWAILRTGVE